MEFIFILLGIVVLYLIIQYTKKSSYFNKVELSLESETLLLKYFKEKDFLHINTTLELKEVLDIKTSASTNHPKSTKKILDQSKHKSEIFHKNSVKSNKTYDEYTTFKLIANEVIDYCLTKEIKHQGAIKLLLNTLSDQYIVNLFESVKSDKEILETFYKLLPGFISRYNKRLSE